MTDITNKAVGVILTVVAVVIAINVWMSQATSVASLTNTGTGLALANAGITSTTLAGTIYGFINPLWAVGVLVIIGSALAMKKLGVF